MTIRIRTKRDVIKSVLIRYENQYSMKDKGYRLFDGRSPIEVARQLRLLDLENCAASDVDDVLRTDGWTANKCEECQTDNDRIVFIGSGEDSIGVCKDCLLIAIDVIVG